MSNRIKILIPGKFKWLGKEACLARCTTTLIQAAGKNIIVDPGNASGAAGLRQALSKLKLKPADIDMVVNTHGHGDHAGASFLFPWALVIADNSVQKGEEYVLYKQKYPLWLAEDVWVMATPGHTSEDISVLVKTKGGTVAVVGDLFWSNQSASGWAYNKRQWQSSRQQIIKLADYIIPGHGKMFKVKK